MLDNSEEELSINEKKVLLALKKLNGKASVKEIYKLGDFKDENEVVNAASWLRFKGLVGINERIKTIYHLGKEGKRILKDGFPERRALEYIMKNRNKRIKLESLEKVLKNYEIPIAIGWLKKRDWATIKKEKDGTFLEITDSGKKYSNKETEDEKTLRLLEKNPYIEMDKNKIKSLKSRKDFIEEKENMLIEVHLTDKGNNLLKRGLKIEEEISQITSRMIKSGSWKGKKIRAYDVDVFAPAIYGGKPHPLVHLRELVREIFISMGFEEVRGNYVESAFWNMDILFIPQDHPARDMQDTLYCKKPSNIGVDKNILDTIKNVHENGGKTGSKGWNYRFSKREARRVLLRTHTTVNTIRYLYKNPKPPAKVFSIEKVFRRENLDSTHLPEFYQIEGIVHEDGANFRQLIGILKEFYKKMGFHKIRFRPAYFPYTEPSMEIEVMWNGKWMELGGSGIFRPEVTLPVGVKNPVLAWGLGLERLAMLKFGLKDIRKLYITDLDWLRNTPLI